MPEIFGLIPAAGKGVRAYPYTQELPKSLLEVDGKPLLQGNVELMRDELGLRRIVVVVGHLGDRIREFLGDGSRFDVEVTYVVNDRLDLELPYSIYLGSKQFEGPCCIVLADECYVGTNHRDLLRTPTDDLLTCAIIEAEYPRAVRNNYTVELNGSHVVGLHEKPQVVTSLLMGTGTYVVQPEAKRRLAETFAKGRKGPGDWTGWIDQLARSGAPVGAFKLDGHYVNVNNRNELNHANHLLREREFASRTTSVVYVSDQTEVSAEAAILPFAERPEVSEVVVVTRQESPSLEASCQHEKIRILVHDDPSAQVGDLLRAGLDAAVGDMLITTLSDDTFAPRDIAKLLTFLRDADLVVGTRTTRQMIEQGSNMRGAVRIAHLLLAKLLEVFWWRFDSRFTDICCVYRGVWRNTYVLIRDQLESHGVEIFPEIVIEVLRARRRVVEIPVNYYNRDLVYSHVHSRYQNVGTFLRILKMMVHKRAEELRLSRPS
ncbi:MAG: NTP transferase domain-containing protein [Candidatus Binatia bacterium]|nr:NTP transferase domain-containing protein [Candidatus Binatia bacterium]